MKTCKLFGSDRSISTTQDYETEEEMVAELYQHLCQYEPQVGDIIIVTQREQYLPPRCRKPRYREAEIARYRVGENFAVSKVGDSPEEIAEICRSLLGQIN